MAGPANPARAQLTGPCGVELLPTPPIPLDRPAAITAVAAAGSSSAAGSPGRVPGGRRGGYDRAVAGDDHDRGDCLMAADRATDGRHDQRGAICAQLRLAGPGRLALSPRRAPAGTAPSG